MSQERKETQTKMPAPIASATMGMIDPLLSKLNKLSKYKMSKEVMGQVSSLIPELNAIKAALEKLELMDELDLVDNRWRDFVKEMSADMENHIDGLMGNLGGADTKTGFINKTSQRLKRLRKRRQIARQIQQLQENAERLRYKIDDVATADHGLSTIYKEATREELVNCLTDTEKKLKVVSIVGFRGLGKTALAKEVYDEIRGQFICKAFVSVSKNPDMTRLLNGLQLELGMDLEESSGAPEGIEEQSSPSRKLQDTAGQLREYLTHKTHLIVIDDLWDQSAWNTISSIFAKDENGSRVIVTTQVDDVALSACQNDCKYIYKMKALKEEDSRRLFFNTVFKSEDRCPPALKEDSDEILKKCGGFPLAVVTIADLLASRQCRLSNEFESINNSLDTSSAENLPLEEVRSRYMQLPLRLQRCLLYLGMYPKDHKVKRDVLIRQWIAEGFVRELEGRDLEDVAKSYLNELINRDLIQAKRTDNGEVMSCTLHCMVLAFILERCTEENFIQVAYWSEEIATMHGKVDRLSLQFDEEQPASIGNGLLQVRSIALFGNSIGILLSFKYVQVLVVEIQLTADTDKKVDLAVINQLSKLKYLKILARQRIRLPEIQGLVHLERLELDCRHQLSVLPYIADLPSLVHLILPKHCRVLPGGIGNMKKSLLTLNWFDVGEKLHKDINELGELTSLRNLRISNHTMGPLATEEAHALASSIKKLQGLRYLHIDGLHIDGWNEAKDDQLMKSLSSTPLVKLEVLRLRNCSLITVPEWIGNLRKLCHLDLRVWEISNEGIGVLGNLSSLVNLYLWEVCFAEGRPVVVLRSFPALEHLELRSREDVTARLRFEEGAMPNLRELSLRFDGRLWGGATPAGMEHLLCLQQIRLHKFPRQDQIPGAKSAFRNATQAHPACPSFTISG